MFTATDGKPRSQRPDRFALVLMVATLLSPSIATTAEPVLPAGSSFDIAGLLSVLLKLAIVLALIVAAGWALKRMQRVKRGSSKSLEVLDVLAVGPKERILLVRAGDMQLLVGMTPGRLNTLQRLDRPLSYAEHQSIELAGQSA